MTCAYISLFWHSFWTITFYVSNSGSSPSLDVSYCSASHDSGFVNISARFLAKGIYSKLTSPDFTLSFAKWCLILMCFVYQWFFPLVVFAIDPWLSAKIGIGVHPGSPISFRNLVNHTAWAVTLVNAIYSVFCSDLAWDDLITFQAQVDKENSMELPLDSVYYLYNYYMVCALLFYTHHITPLYNVILWHPDMWLWCMTFVMWYFSHTPSLCSKSK